MSKQIAIFTFENQNVRTATHENGEVYFCLPDVAKVLDIKNSRDIVAKQLNKKGVEKIYTPTEGGKQQIVFINEPNLYRVIFRSNKEEAIKFQDWVFEEVLPTIRKTDEYKTKTTSIDRTPLRNACDRLAVTNMLTSDAYKIVWEQYGVNDIDQIPANKLPEAVAFVYEMILRLKSSDPTAKPQPQQRQLYDILFSAVSSHVEVIRMTKTMMNALHMGYQENSQLKYIQQYIEEAIKYSLDHNMTNMFGEKLYENGRLHTWHGGSFAIK